MNKEMHTSEMLWKDALLVLDSSLLVLLKQLNKEFAIDIIDFLMFKKNDIWIPQKVNEEVQYGLENLKNIKSGAIGRINGFKTKLSQSIDKIKSSFISIAEEAKKDGYDLVYDILTNADVDSFFINILSEYEKEEGQLREENKKFLKSGVLQAFYEFIEKKADSGFTESEIRGIEQEGKIRYLERIPPGYKDVDKKNGNEFGDLII